MPRRGAEPTPIYLSPSTDSGTADGVGGNGEDSSSLPTTTNRNRNPAVVTVAQARRALAECGVARQDRVLERAAPSRVFAWCQWWKRERDRRGPGIGSGALVERILSPDEPPERVRSFEERQRDYGEQIADWLRRRMPGVCPESEREQPHFAAIAVVLRLHQEYGKGRLTVREHGPTIQAAVVDAQRRFDLPPIRGEAT